MLNLKRDLIRRALKKDEFVSLDGLRGSTVKDRQDIAFNMFIYNMLDSDSKGNSTEIGHYDDEKMNGSYNEMKNAIAELNDIIKKVKRDKFTIETKEVNENYTIVYQFDLDDKDEIIDFLECSCLKYRVDVDYEEERDEIEEEIDEIESEDEAYHRDPYGYYGVSQKDFM